MPIQIRRDTAADWTSNNPTLSIGQPGYEDDTGKMKIGDGSTAWNSLGYFGEGKQTIYISASGITPATTSGAASSQIETTTNKVNYNVLAFDDTVAEYGHFNVKMPKSWDQGTVTFFVVWESAATGTEGIAWGLEAVAFADGDTIDAAYGTAVYVIDNAQTSAAKRYITAESGAVTIGGSPGADEIVEFRISRDPTNGSDNLGVDGLLVGVQLIYTTDWITDD